jgi:hypothetical protein
VVSRPLAEGRVNRRERPFFEITGLKLASFENDH